MAGKNSRSSKQNRTEEEAITKRQKASQIIFAVFAVILILSMVVSAFATY